MQYVYKMHINIVVVATSGPADQKSNFSADSESKCFAAFVPPLPFAMVPPTAFSSLIIAAALKLATELGHYCSLSAILGFLSLRFISERCLLAMRGHSLWAARDV